LNTDTWECYTGYNKNGICAIIPEFDWNEANLCHGPAMHRTQDQKQNMIEKTANIQKAVSAAC